MERRLRALNPELHRRFTDAIFALQYNLSHYKLIFPEYTDHSNLHSMTVIDFCNRLIGSQIQSLDPDELYVLLMGC
jgi:capsule polysaccharide modification protein KpsS